MAALLISQAPRGVIWLTKARLITAGLLPPPRCQPHLLLRSMIRAFALPKMAKWSPPRNSAPGQATQSPSCPPLAAANVARDVRLLAGGFDPAIELSGFTARYPEAGAVVSFLGQVRQQDRGGDEVEALELQHYAPLTLPGMQALAAEAAGRWRLSGLLILHRVGELAVGDPIVLVVAAARHRRDAFAAADFTMDHLKSEAWFWKRERRAGVWHWIEPRAADYDDLARWQPARI